MAVIVDHCPQPGVASCVINLSNCLVSFREFGEGMFITPQVEKLSHT